MLLMKIGMYIDTILQKSTFAEGAKNRDFQRGVSFHLDFRRSEIRPLRRRWRERGRVGGHFDLLSTSATTTGTGSNPTKENVDCGSLTTHLNPK
jgi:hypothetical protein